MPWLYRSGPQLSTPWRYCTRPSNARIKPIIHQLRWEQTPWTLCRPCGPHPATRIVFSLQGLWFVRKENHDNIRSEKNRITTTRESATVTIGKICLNNVGCVGNVENSSGKYTYDTYMQDIWGHRIGTILSSLSESGAPLADRHFYRLDNELMHQWINGLYVNSVPNLLH